MKKLYYIYLIIKETIEPIPAKEIRRLLLEKYQIKIDIKTIYQGIENLNEFFGLFCGKKLIKTIRRRGYCIEEEYFNDGQLQYLLDSILFNKDINADEVAQFIKGLTSLSSAKQLSRITINPLVTNQNEYHYLYLISST